MYFVETLLATSKRQTVIREINKCIKCNFLCSDVASNVSTTDLHNINQLSYHYIIFWVFVGVAKYACA